MSKRTKPGEARVVAASELLTAVRFMAMADGVFSSDRELSDHWVEISLDAIRKALDPFGYRLEPNKQQEATS